MMYDIVLPTTHDLNYDRYLSLGRHIGHKRSLRTEKISLNLPLGVGAFGFLGTSSSCTGFTGTGFSGSWKVHIGNVMLNIIA